MWLSKQTAPSGEREEQAAVATVSMAEQGVAAVSDAEYRNLRLLSPGGFAWRPSVSDKVLLLKDTALGALTQSPVSLQAGECCLFANGCSVHMKNDGSIRISGTVYINGTEVQCGGE